MENPILEVFQRHFPGKKFNELDDLFWNELTMTFDRSRKVINIDQNKKLLDKIETSLRQALGALDELAPIVRDELEDAYKRNAQDRLGWAPGTVIRDKFKGQSGEISTVVNARETLARLVQGLSGERRERINWSGDRKQPSAYHCAKLVLTDCDDETAQARAHETWTKVRLVEQARKAWIVFNGEAPPRVLNPASPFASFLDDLIMALGETWDPVSTHNAWRRNSQVDS